MMKKMKSSIQFHRQRSSLSKSLNRMLIMNLLTILFILFGIFHSSIQSQKNVNEPEFGARLNNRPQTSIASHNRHGHRYKQQKSSDLNQNNYHGKKLNSITSSSSSPLKTKLEKKKNLDSNNNNSSSSGGSVVGNVRIFRKKNNIYSNNGKKPNFPSTTTLKTLSTNNQTVLNITNNNHHHKKWPINNKEMINIDAIATTNKVKANKSANNNNSIDDNDQSASESIYSNQYVVVGHHDHHHHSNHSHKQLLQQEQEHHHHAQDDQEKFIRQPILVDNLMAMSNELPPLTAALPMHYLSHHESSSSMDSHLSPSLFAADPNVASLYAPHSSTDESINGGLIEKPGIIMHHTFPMALNHQQPITHHYYDPSSYLGRESSGLIDSSSMHNHHNAIMMNDHIPGIPGKPWKDYPMYSQVPKTTFHCNGAYGYFADLETGCQLWHYCQPDGRHDSFLCTNGTLFNQMTRVCDWWYNVDCEMSPHLYGVNADLYKQPLAHLQPLTYHQHNPISHLI
uniref:Probable serine/threonine-protein kinase DDB_G0280133 n=1 Tax=Dermatophagoides pteronyssinus TaxID=6956 RepID=A0A6P6XQC1_DERPT|nr:probable serine/threonine-protein kinase DDB_G0280133 [Dermatophagoides pteronyssinus]